MAFALAVRNRALAACIIIFFAGWCFADENPSATSQPSESSAAPAAEPETFRWYTDYREAVNAAQASHKMLFVWFYNAKITHPEADFANKIVTDANVHARLQKTIAVCIPTDAVLKTAAGDISILRHAAFSEMHGRAGVAVVDYTKGSPYYGRVVSAYPYRGRPMGAGELATLLDLPVGSLTQRTLVMAVRMHPEAPASTRGQADPYIFSEAEAHSNHMASIRVQGHHNFDTRFQRMTARMPGGTAAKEVCAESWPGKGMVDAAEDLVDSWRQSSGHWSAVRNYHVAYGYDMKLGSNGIWYGTGIFAAAPDR